MTLSGDADEPADALRQILRWIDLGGTWQVLDERADGATVALCQCDGGREQQRLRVSGSDLAELRRDHTNHTGIAQ